MSMQAARASVCIALLVAILGATDAAQATAQSCIIPPVSQNFTHAAYEGIWYEIARFQTFGGAIFQTGCECTALNVTVSTSADYILQVANQCRRFSPTAPITTVVGHLYNETYPGQFSETIISFEKPVRYNVIHVDESSAIEYDCGEALFDSLNYCIHFMSRTPTMSNDTLSTLVAYAESFGLNAHQLPLKITPQEGCW